MLALEEKNKQLTGECQALTIRMLEEKSKMVEMMNEANNIYDEARTASLTMTDQNRPMEYNQNF